jgi:hypothetical protein
MTAWRKLVRGLDPIFDPYPWAAPLEEVRLKRP